MSILQQSLTFQMTLFLEQLRTTFALHIPLQFLAIFLSGIIFKNSRIHQVSDLSSIKKSHLTHYPTIHHFLLNQTSLAGSKNIFSSTLHNTLVSILIRLRRAVTSGKPLKWQNRGLTRGQTHKRVCLLRRRERGRWVGVRKTIMKKGKRGLHLVLGFQTLAYQSSYTHTALTGSNLL